MNKEGDGLSSELMKFDRHQRKGGLLEVIVRRGVLI